MENCKDCKGRLMALGIHRTAEDTEVVWCPRCEVAYDPKTGEEILRFRVGVAM